jgi:hypothetical protein
MRHCFSVPCSKMAVEASKTTEGLFGCGNTFHILLINKRPLGSVNCPRGDQFFRLKAPHEEDLVGNVVEPEQVKDLVGSEIFFPGRKMIPAFYTLKCVLFPN